MYTVENAGSRIKGELLSNGKGLILPSALPLYSPESTITITMELQGLIATKLLTPNFCIENYVIVRQGSSGSSGTRGNNGSSGGSGSSGDRGDSGEDGPDITVQIEEETVASKSYIVLIVENKKYRLDPECSTIQIISRGGNGGRGGRGGNGGDSPKSKNEYTGSGGRGGYGGAGGSAGDGGTITVTGSALEKYKSKITFLSEGGKGGDGGEGGRGGDGKSTGRSGTTGSNGSSGSAGQVIFKNN